jgi:polyisoprenoid-binding protein YceI
MKFFKLGLASLAVSTALFAGNYTVDAGHTNAGFTVKHMMITNVTGKFNDVAGTFEFDEKTKNLKSVSGEIITASIDTSNEKRDEHLKAPELFDAAQFPKITFKSTKIEKNKVYGDLTMKGITKAVIFDLETSDVITDPWGKQRTGFSLNGKIKRTDFGISWNKALETGGVAVSDEVKLSIDIEGVLAK